MNEFFETAKELLKLYPHMLQMFQPALVVTPQVASVFLEWRLGNCPENILRDLLAENDCEEMLSAPERYDGMCVLTVHKRFQHMKSCDLVTFGKKLKKLSKLEQRILLGELQHFSGKTRNVLKKNVVKTLVEGRDCMSPASLNISRDELRLFREKMLEVCRELELPQWMVTAWENV